MASDPFNLPQSGVAAEILVIDDDASVRDMLSIYLQTKGFPVHVIRRPVRHRPLQDAVARTGAVRPAHAGHGRTRGAGGTQSGFPRSAGAGDLRHRRHGRCHPGPQARLLDYITKPIEDFAVLDHALGKALERARLVEENRAYRAHLEAANEKARPQPEAAGGGRGQRAQDPVRHAAAAGGGLRRFPLQPLPGHLGHPERRLRGLLRHRRRPLRLLHGGRVRTRRVVGGHHRVAEELRGATWRTTAATAIAPSSIRRRCSPRSTTTSWWASTASTSPCSTAW